VGKRIEEKAKVKRGTRPGSEGLLGPNQIDI